MDYSFESSRTLGDVLGRFHKDPQPLKPKGKPRVPKTLTCDEALHRVLQSKNHQDHLAELTDPQEREDWIQAFKDRWFKGRAYTLIDVPLEHLNARKFDLDEKKVESLVKDPPKDDGNHPIIGQYEVGHATPHVVLDGNHRVEAARRRGDNNLHAYVEEGIDPGFGVKEASGADLAVALNHFAVGARHNLGALVTRARGLAAHHTEDMKNRVAGAIANRVADQAAPHIARMMTPDSIGQVMASPGMKSIIKEHVPSDPLDFIFGRKSAGFLAPARNHLAYLELSRGKDVADQIRAIAKTLSSKQKRTGLHHVLNAHLQMPKKEAMWKSAKPRWQEEMESGRLSVADKGRINELGTQRLRHAGIDLTNMRLPNRHEGLDAPENIPGVRRRMAANRPNEGMGDMVERHSQYVKLAPGVVNPRGHQPNAPLDSVGSYGRLMVHPSAMDKEVTFYHGSPAGDHHAAIRNDGLKVPKRQINTNIRGGGPGAEAAFKGVFLTPNKEVAHRFMSRNLGSRVTTLADGSVRHTPIEPTAQETRGGHVYEVGLTGRDLRDLHATGVDGGPTEAGREFSVKHVPKEKIKGMPLHSFLPGMAAKAGWKGKAIAGAGVGALSLGAYLLHRHHAQADNQTTDKAASIMEGFDPGDEWRANFQAAGRANWLALQEYSLKHKDRIFESTLRSIEQSHGGCVADHVRELSQGDGEITRERIREAYLANQDNAAGKRAATVFLGGKVSGPTGDWREEVKPALEALGHDPIDPKKKNWDPGKDIYKEVAQMLTADEVVFLKGGGTFTRREKGLLDAVGKRYTVVDRPEHVIDHVEGDPMQDKQAYNAFIPVDLLSHATSPFPEDLDGQRMTQLKAMNQQNSLLLEALQAERTGRLPVHMVPMYAHLKLASARAMMPATQQPVQQTTQPPAQAPAGPSAMSFAHLADDAVMYGAKGFNAIKSYLSERGMPKMPPIL
jgi:hypothetical protein